MRNRESRREDHLLHRYFQLVYPTKRAKDYFLMVAEQGTIGDSVATLDFVLEAAHRIIVPLAYMCFSDEKIRQDFLKQFGERLEDTEQR